ncbi:MAG: hypothetical protein ABC578_07185, partial [Candidatus Methanosuratincola petrocarbonis]
MSLAEYAGMGLQHEPLKTDEEFIELNRRYVSDPAYRDALPQIVKAAHQYGYIRYGWNLYDYLI